MYSKRGLIGIVLFAFFCGALPVYAADVTVNVNASSHIRTIPMTLYGGNLASWDGSMSGGNTTFNNLAKASGCKYFRVPGGSWGNGLLWSDIEGPNGSQGWKVSYNEYLNLMSLISQPGEEVHPTLQPIVNFPGWWYDHCQDNNPTDDVCDWAQAHTSAVNAAVGWVTDQTARATCAQYWEIGNEIGGPWEVGYFPTISGTYYGDYFADFYLAMKAVNPNIKIGACAEPTNDPQPWGWYQGLWDHDTLLAAQVKGVVPDFFIIHSYQNGGGDGNAPNNPTLLGSQIDQIAQWTSNLNSIIQNTLGAQYVGKIGYYMTEWNTSGTDTYDRPSCYVNAMFRAQYILEMAKNKWIGSNPWIYDYGNNYSVFPVWYVNPMLINKFGRNMVTTYSDNATVRAYSSIDGNDNLTMFIVNNSPTTDLTAQIDISGMTIGSGGQQWLMEPAGNIISGGLTIQDKGDISINGTVHPNPLTVGSIAPQSFTSGDSFTITLPKSCMMLLRMPGIGVDTTPPAAPTGLTAASDVGHISLDWSDNSEGDLAGYNVYRSSTSGSGYIKQNSSPVTSSNYTDNLVLIGQTYYYIVTAVDVSWNESAYSNQASAAAISDTIAPAAPTGLTATATTGAVLLNWNDNTEADLAGYNVYRGTASGGPYSKINASLAANSSYTDSRGSNGTTYYYIVKAVDKTFNESGGSNEASATSSDTTPPARPTGLTATAVNGTVSLDWNDNNEPDLAGYNIYRGTSSGGPYSILNGSTLLTSSDYIDSTVTAGITYYYVVRARDLNTNLSSNSNQASILLTDITPPAAPTGLTAIAGSGTISLDWNDNGESDLAGYNVYRGTSSGGPYSRINGSLVSSSNYNDNSVISGTTYYYVVRAADTHSNESGNSSQVSATSIDTTAPACPTGLIATAGVSTVSLDWNNNVEGDLAGYYVYRSVTSGGIYTRLNGTLLSSSNYTDNSAINGTTYYYIVTAVDNSSNESDNSNEVSATPQPDTASPAAPTGLKVTATAGNAVSLDWNDNGEPDMNGYSVYRSTTSGSGYVRLNGTILTSSNYTDNSISNGITYYYIVRAVDIYSNESANSGEVSAATGTGAILREWWTGITTGSNVSNLTSDVNYPTNPNGRELLTSLEGPVGWADNYGTRIRGYLYPPANGNYTFWIASDDSSQLWLSTDADPCHATQIAYVTGWTNSHEWTKYSSQVSASKSLLAGHKYYIEVLHKEGGGGDNIAVAWSGPGITQQVIDGMYLSPWLYNFKDYSTFAGQWQKTNCSRSNAWCSGADRDRDGNVQIDDLMTFADWWLYDSE